MGKFYATYNLESGEIVGFRPIGDTYPTPTPMPYIVITPEQHTDFFARGQNHRVINDVWTYVEPELQAPEVVTPPVDQDTADMWEAILSMSAELEIFKGGQ